MSFAGFASLWKSWLQLAVRGGGRVVRDERAMHDRRVRISLHGIHAPHDAGVPGVVPFDDTTSRPPGMPPGAGMFPDANCVPSPRKPVMRFVSKSTS